MYLKAYIQNLVKNGLVVSEKGSFNFQYMISTLNTHIPLLTHLPTFKSSAALVSENPLFTLFPIEKPKLQIFDPAIK